LNLIIISFTGCFYLFVSVAGILCRAEGVSWFGSEKKSKEFEDDKKKKESIEFIKEKRS